MNASGLHDVHSYTQHFEKIGEQSAEVEQAPALIQIHEEVDVTVRPVFAGGHRAEHSDIAAAV